MSLESLSKFVLLGGCMFRIFNIRPSNCPRAPKKHNNSINKKLPHVSNNRIINALKSMLNYHEYQKKQTQAGAQAVLARAVFYIPTCVKVNPEQRSDEGSM